MGHYCSTVLGRVWLCESKDIYIVGKTFLFHINAVPLKFLFIYIHGFLKNIASLFSTLIITFMFLGNQISILECFLKIVWNGELKLLLSMCIRVYFICRRNDLHVCVLLLISTVITIKSQINCYFEHKKDHILVSLKWEIAHLISLTSPFVIININYVFFILLCLQCELHKTQTNNYFLYKTDGCCY